MADDFDAYQVLGIETGVKSTDADVRRAYRKRAIETHPDKNRHRKDAAKEFDRVKRAYELLMDKDARAAHDHLIRVKEQKYQRYEAMDAKRRKMRDDLEAKEKEEWRKKSAEELAREKLQVRKKGILERKCISTNTSEWSADSVLRNNTTMTPQAELERIRHKMAGSGAATTKKSNVNPFWRNNSSHPSPIERTEIDCMLKVAWDLGKGDYSASELKGIFAKHGTVEDVVVKTSKKNRGSALVLMSRAGEVRAACRQGFCGRPDNPLELTPLGVDEKDPQHGPHETPHSGTKGTEDIFQSAKLTSDFENKVLARMKEAQARARGAEGRAKDHAT